MTHELTRPVAAGRAYYLRLYRPSVLERLIWCIGIALLGSYAGLRFWTEQERRIGIDSFYVAAEQARAAPRVTTPPVDAEDTLLAVLPEPSPPPLTTSAPDTDTWSAGRIAAFLPLGADVVPQAILRVRSLQLEVPVFAGVTESHLNAGAAHIAGTAPLGSDGNVGLAAHRDGYFRSLGDINIGDEIVIETTSGIREYRVTETRIVLPEDVAVLAPTNGPVLTLVTCYPFYFIGPAPQRFIVRAALVRDNREILSAQFAPESYAAREHKSRQPAQTEQW